MKAKKNIMRESWAQGGELEHEQKFCIAQKFHPLLAHKYSI